jgi:hypothetical protein
MNTSYSPFYFSSHAKWRNIIHFMNSSEFGIIVSTLLHEVLSDFSSIVTYEKWHLWSINEPVKQKFVHYVPISDTWQLARKCQELMIKYCLGYIVLSYIYASEGIKAHELAVLYIWYFSLLVTNYDLEMLCHVWTVQFSTFRTLYRFSQVIS